VELTLALHRVFDSPRPDPVGHRAPGLRPQDRDRSRARFDTLRQQDGLSGYPSAEESEHDVIANSHASTALSYADGLAKAYQLRGQGRPGRRRRRRRRSLTGGWPGRLNNIAADHTRRLVIVVNDNERSYSPTVGGLAHHLATLRTTRGYERFLEWGKQVLGRTPVVGPPIYDALHGVKKGLKDVVAPQGMFEDLGLKYIGPVDGHDVEAVEHATTGPAVSAVRCSSTV
jgi:1-deoxy-D-xylulose-5-phosphate synthase